MVKLYIYYNLSPNGKDKLTGDILEVFTKDISTFIPFLIIFQAQIPALAQNLTFVLISGPMGIYTNVIL